MAWTDETFSRFKFGVQLRDQQSEATLRKADAESQPRLEVTFNRGQVSEDAAERAGFA